jgi:predicted amidohydrolase YtcJ
VIALLSQDEKLDMVRQGLRYLNQFGITTIVNATGNLAEIELYGALRDRKELTVRTRTAFGAVAYPHRLSPQFLNDLETARTRFHDDWVSSNLVKFFLDGGSHPWLPVYNSQAEFKALVAELDRRGFHVMTHAWLVESTKTALDTYEQIESETGNRDHRFRIEHADKVGLQDLPRFAGLSVVASMQPSFCCSSSRDPAIIDEPWHSLLESGAHLAFNSDWPCTWTPDPFVAMQQAVTRAEWVGQTGYGANQAGRTRTDAVSTPAERVNITQAVDAYTKGGAYAAYMEDKVGTLEVGKLADFAVLSQDIFTVPSMEIAKTRVKMTVVGGRTVYGGPP